MNAPYDSAIIGGGFSGLMIVHHLARQAPSDSCIALFDPSERFGRGLAYSTPNPRHLLNVRAKAMSALPDDPNHLLHWLAAPEGQSATKQLGLDRIWQKDDFIPRALYGDYLDSIARETFATAKARGVEITPIRQPVRSVQETGDGYDLTTEDEQEFSAKSVVLAIGNLSSGTASPSPRIVQNVWNFDFSHVKACDRPVAIIGTGLTAVDVVIALRDAGYSGKIIAASRRGHISHTHDMTEGKYDSVAPLLAKSLQTLLNLLREIRREVHENAAQARSWQIVIDHWRPHLPALWAQLSPKDRKKFFNRLFTLWGIHRHRMATEVGKIVTDERQRGTLDILSGTVNVKSTPDSIDFTVGDQTHNVAWVFDCRGPCYDIRKSNNALLRQLADNGLIAPHNTGWGVAIDDNLKITGSKRLYTIGAPATGARLETIAVPELREQAALIAANLLR